MAGYQIRGPFEVPVDRLKAGRTIARLKLPNFWRELGALADARGCYIFGIKASKNVMPIYVGKATKTFRQECFQPHKLANHYGPALLKYLKGKPVMFLVVQKKSRKGALSTQEIGEIEKFLVQVAVARNPDLSNVHHTKQDQWSIDGVIRGRQGTNSTASGHFKKMMNL